jgi:hypothetical protein
VIRALLLACAALALLAATPAHAGIMSPEDATDLAQSLAEAQEEQEVCYGWDVSNNFGAGSDTGSSIGGPGAALLDVAGTCKRGVVILTGSIDYSCGSCESSDSASVSIQASGLANPPTVGDLEDLGLKAGDLTGDNDDTTLINMVEALPLLVADKGNAPYVEYEQATTVPPTDRATNKPGSDFLRDNWIWLLLCVALIALGPIYYLYKRAQVPKAKRTPRDEPDAEPDEPAEPPASTSSQPPPTSAGPTTTPTGPTPTT